MKVKILRGNLHGFGVISVEREWASFDPFFGSACWKRPLLLVVTA
jgi:hypothetical protein